MVVESTLSSRVAAPSCKSEPRHSHRTKDLKNVLCNLVALARISVVTSPDSIPRFVRYRSIPEFFSILDTYVVIKSNFHIEHSSQ